MPTPNDLVSVTITAATGDQTAVFKPSSFLYCKIVVRPNANSSAIYYRVDVYTTTFPNGITFTSAGVNLGGLMGVESSLTYAEANAGVTAVYTAVNAYYTAINT
jgi:hypothetical protein